jgi:hypothetical protein
MQPARHEAGPLAVALSRTLCLPRIVEYGLKRHSGLSHRTFSHFFSVRAKVSPTVRIALHRFFVVVTAKATRQACSS